MRDKYMAGEKYWKILLVVMVITSGGRKATFFGKILKSLLDI